MKIIIDCQCEKTIVYDDDEYLYGEDSAPHELTCPDCGAKIDLYIHIKYRGGKNVYDN